MDEKTLKKRQEEYRHYLMTMQKIERYPKGIRCSCCGKIAQRLFPVKRPSIAPELICEECAGK